MATYTGTINFALVNELSLWMETCCCLNEPHGGNKEQQANFSTAFAVSSVISDVIVMDPGVSQEKKGWSLSLINLYFIKKYLKHVMWKYWQ